MQKIKAINFVWISKAKHKVTLSVENKDKIAKVLKISESAVKKRLERARTFMKEIIERSDIEW